MLGDTLGDRYLLSGLLGTGGMAEVFLAHDRMLGRDTRAEGPKGTLRQRRALRRALPEGGPKRRRPQPPQRGADLRPRPR